MTNGIIPYACMCIRGFANEFHSRQIPWGTFLQEIFNNPYVIGFNVCLRNYLTKKLPDFWFLKVHRITGIPPFMASKMLHNVAYRQEQTQIVTNGYILAPTIAHSQPKECHPAHVSNAAPFVPNVGAGSSESTTRAHRHWPSRRRKHAVKSEW